MKSNLGLGLVLAGLVGVVALVWFGTRSLSSPPSAALLAQSQGETEEPAEPAAVEPSAVRNERGDPTTATAPERTAQEAPQAAPVEESADPVRIRGKTVDFRGGAVGGVSIGTALRGSPGLASEVLAISANDGAFALFLAPSGQDIVAIDDAYTTVRSSHLTGINWEHEHVIVVAPSVDVSGRVLDESGRPLANARVDVQVARKVWSEFPDPLDKTRLESWGVATGTDGAFDLRGIPAFAGAALRASREGYAPASVPVPLSSRVELLLELRPAGADSITGVTGTVFQADGNPAEGAQVRLDGSKTETDVNGRFELKVEWAHDDAPLVATMEGVQGAVVQRYGAIYNEADGQPAPVVLRLGAEALAISGVLVDADRKPQRGWNIDLLDGTEVSRGQVPAVVLEALTSRRKAIQTDRQGAFRISGLQDRAYRVRVWNRQTLVQFDSQPIEAGREDVEIVLPEDVLLPVVAGHVRNTRGLPLERVSVRLSLVTSRIEMGMTTHSGESVMTDAQGAFSFENVPVQNIQLRVAGESVMPKPFELAEFGDPENIELIVAERCHFRVVNAKGNRISVVAADGTNLSLHTMQSNQWSSSNTVALAEGQSHVVSASEGRYTLVLRDRDEVLEQRPLVLVPGEILVVDFAD